MIDTSIVATSLYQIARDFDVVVAINWVALAYTLAYLGCSIVFSRISDVIGRREAFMAAYVLFLVFSIACGFAQNLNQLIAFRALQGVGGSGMFYLSHIQSSRTYRTRSLLINHDYPTRTQSGPFENSYCDHDWHGRCLVWRPRSCCRWNFDEIRLVAMGVLDQVSLKYCILLVLVLTILSGPLGFVSMIIFFFSWPKPQHLPTIERRSWREVDYLGSLLTISSATLVVFAFQDAGESGRWAQAVFIAPLVVGVCGWISLIAWQFVIDHLYSDRIMPAFPVNVFRSRAYSTAVFSTLLLGFPYLLLVYTVPMRIQVIGGKSSVIAGVLLLPMLGAAAIGTITAGKINSVKNYIFETLFVGSSFMLLGCGLLTTLSNSLDTGKLLGFLVFVGFGFGLTICASTMLSTIEVSIRDFGKFSADPP